MSLYQNSELTRKTIDFLKEQLVEEPDNLQVRMQLASLYIQIGEIDKARKQVDFVKKIDPTSPDIELLEKIMDGKNASQDTENNGKQDNSAEKYPSSPIAEIKLEIKQGEDEALSDVKNWFEKPKTTFDQVGGMDDLKEEIKVGIIYPFQKPELYKKYGKKIGGGILLYGPPGCGKTFIARATAGEIDAEFISVGIEEVLDMYIGQSERNIHQLFVQARESAPSVMFFDEVDALSGDRMKSGHKTALVNQFLTEMDGMNGANDQIMIIGATNTPWQVDPAFKRPGRFDKVVFVPPPDKIARAEIFKLCLKDKPIDSVDYLRLADLAKNYSGADITKVCDMATETVMREVFAGGNERNITMKDLEKAIKSTKSSILEWFAMAKNFAKFANESGNYTPILKYIDENSLSL
ncbi:MAG: AAA family ATPase [Patescibacteria group bacterium]